MDCGVRSRLCAHYVHTIVTWYVAQIPMQLMCGRKFRIGATSGYTFCDLSPTNTYRNFESFEPANLTGELLLGLSDIQSG
jgi:hypothetical protein